MPGEQMILPGFEEFVSSEDASVVLPSVAGEVQVSKIRSKSGLTTVFEIRIISEQRGRGEGRSANTP